MPALARDVIANHAKLGDEQTEVRLRKMFAVGQLDAVVLVNFDLDQQAVSWPGPEAVRVRAQRAGRAMFKVGSFSRVETSWFTIIRPT